MDANIKHDRHSYRYKQATQKKKENKCRRWCCEAEQTNNRTHSNVIMSCNHNTNELDLEKVRVDGGTKTKQKNKPHIIVIIT